MTEKKKKVTDNIEELMDSEAPTEVTFSTGVTLEIKAVPPLMLIRAMARTPRPEVPEHYFPDLGRSHLHPEDEGYISEVEAWEQKNQENMIAFLVLFGTELKSVPKGMEKPGSDDWVNMLSAIGELVEKDDKHWRYLTWVQTLVLKTQEDIESLMEAISRLSGVAESDVEDAATFPGSS